INASDIGGAPKLSAQERRVMALYGGGEPVKSVAFQLGISEETAKSYLKRIREKYRVTGIVVSTKVALRRRAIQDGILIQDSATGIFYAGTPVSRRVALRAALLNQRGTYATRHRRPRERQRSPGHAHEQPDPGRREVAPPGSDDRATQERAERVADVERRVVDGGGERLALPGNVHEPR